MESFPVEFKKFLAIRT